MRSYEEATLKTLEDKVKALVILELTEVIKKRLDRMEAVA